MHCGSCLPPSALNAQSVMSCYVALDHLGLGAERHNILPQENRVINLSHCVSVVCGRSRSEGAPSGVPSQSEHIKPRTDAAA
jgi:hypothetical protein